MTVEFTTVGERRYQRVDKKDGATKPPRIDVETKHIPEALANLPRWVCWKWERRDNKWTKPPYSPLTGQHAKADDPATWASYPEAMSAYRRDKSYAGVGFVFVADDDLMGVDVDDCLQPDGTVSATGQQALSHFKASYCEVSPSGTGLKCIIRGSIPGAKTGRKNPALDVETYASGRYFTVTGRRWPGSPSEILDRQAELNQWCAEVFPAAKPPEAARVPTVPVSATVAEIIERASAAKNGDMFRALWAGDCSRFGDDQSSADLALCSLLAFWCGPDPKLMDQCFRASGLMREKWERQDYREATIAKALAGRTDFYQWGRNGSSVSFFIGPDNPETGPEPEGWPDLIPIAGMDPEPMHAGDFPPCVAAMIQAVVDMAEVPVELPGLMALGVMATAAQKKFRIACDRSHTEPLNLFVCPALPPGERKTAVVQVLTEPLRQWEMMERERLRPIIREIESSRKTAERRIEHLRTKASRTEDSIERDDLQREIDAIERELPSVPALPQLLIDDCTPEHVATMLHRHGERLAIVSDEGGIFDIVAGRYSRGVPNLDVFLQGHAGSPVRVNRGSREPVDLRSPCLTAAVSCQPFVLQEMGQNKAFQGRGLLSRFLFAVPKSRLGYRTLRTAEIPPVVRDRWNRLVCRMLDFEQESDDFGNLRSRTIALSQGAYALWKNEQRANELDMRPGGAWADNTGWASKYPGAVLRIAGVLHCAICADAGQDPGAIHMAEPTMLSAITLGRKIKGHSLQAFGMMALTDDQKFAHKIIEWIRRESVTEFTGRECAVHCNSAGSVRDLDGAFELLADRGWIRLGQRRKPEGGGRPSQPFEVNPAVAQFDDKTDETRLEGEYPGSDCAKLDDKTDETRQWEGDRGVLSVLSSVSAQADPKAGELVGRPDPAVDDEFQFSFASDHVPF